MPQEGGAQDAVRFAPLQADQLTPEQKKWADTITAPPRNSKFANLPYRAYVRSRELATRLTPLSDYLRWNTSLPARLACLGRYPLDETEISTRLGKWRRLNIVD